MGRLWGKRCLEGFRVWDESYHTDYTYEVILNNGRYIKCFGKGGLMWEIGTNYSYPKEEIKCLRVVNEVEVRQTSNRV